MFYFAVCTYAQKSVGCCDTKEVFVDPYGDELQWVLSDNGAGGKWTGGKDFIQFDIYEMFYVLTDCIRKEHI